MILLGGEVFLMSITVFLELRHRLLPKMERIPLLLAICALAPLMALMMMLSYLLMSGLTLRDLLLQHGCTRALLRSMEAFLRKQLAAQQIASTFSLLT